MQPRNEDPPKPRLSKSLSGGGYTSSVYETREPLHFIHQRIISSIEQLGGAMEAATERPAQLLRDMEGLQQEREREREEWEREREGASEADLPGEERARMQAAEIEDLKRELRVSNMARDAARRESEQSQQRQRSLQLDLNSAQQEMQTMRLELNLLRPYEVAPLPSAALQLDHPELRPAASPRGPPLVRGDASGAANEASGAGSGLSSARQPSARPKAAAGRQPSRHLLPSPSTAKAQRPISAPGSASPSPRGGEQVPYWEQQARQLAKANQRLEGVLAATAFQPYNVPGVSAPRPGRPSSSRPSSARGPTPPGSASPRSPRTPRRFAESQEDGVGGLGLPGGLKLGRADPLLVMMPSMRMR